MTATIPWLEAAARQFESTVPRFATPGDLAHYLDAATVQTPMMDLIDQLCVDVWKDSHRSYTAEGPRKIICTPPQEGKSQRMSRRFPLWALLQNPEARIAIASYEATTARRWGRAIRDDVENNPSLGLRVSFDKAAQNDWELQGHSGGVYTVGVGGALTGRSVDILIIDDPVKGREEADSETYRRHVYEWWSETARTRLSPGAPVILIMTRWHPDDLAGRLIEEGGWDVLSIPAQSEDADTDPLGRPFGGFLESTRGRTAEQWNRLKETTQVRTWSALYQQSPTPPEGLVFDRAWIDQNRRTSGEVTHALVRRVVAIDPAAKSKVTSDETGIVVVALDNRGEAWVLDDRSLRGTPEQWGHAAWTAVLDWKCDEVVVEDNQGGEMVQHVLSATWDTLLARRGLTAMKPRITQVTASQSKRVRAESVATLYQTGKVHHANDGTERLRKLEDQMCTWTGEGSSPDRMDALVHGLRALATPRQAHRQVSTRTR